MPESIAHLELPVDGLVSPRQEQAIDAALSRLPGVTASASYQEQTVKLEFDRRTCALPEIVRRLDNLGVRLRPRGAATATGMAPAPKAKAERTPAESIAPRGLLRLALSQHEVLFALGAGVFLLAGAMIHWLSGPHWARVPLLAVSYFLGGYYPGGATLQSVRGSWLALIGRRDACNTTGCGACGTGDGRFVLDIDILMFAAAFGAAALGHLEEGAMLLFLFSLGGAGEHLAMERARRAIQALATLAPQTAIRLELDGSQREVRVEDLAVGDQIVVRPGEQIAADGVVVAGASAVNQAPITGESVPVDKCVGSDVFAGTLNTTGALTVEVQKPASENTLAKVVRMVEQAQATKSPTQQFTDKIERWYVPLVLVSTVCLIVIPPLVGLAPRQEAGSLWKGWFYQAMSFLTGASPCALAIGTPAAVLSGIARAARGGVLVKGGGHLENLGRVNAIAFDKTGTLTTGRPAVTDVLPLAPDIDESQLLAAAAAVERGSTHPIADAIVAEADAREVPKLTADQIEQTSGMGVTGVVDDGRIAVGKLSMSPPSTAGYTQAQENVERLAGDGKTTVVVADAHRILGVIALADQPRPTAGPMLASLRNLGIRHTIMLTGDNERTAASIAARLGIDEYLAGLMPDDKVAAVRELDRKYHRVAMVGDGVNDAPAMASATVGIAVGGATGAGSDVALETADIALLAADLAQLPRAVAISRFSRRIIVQNVVIAMGVIAVLAPIAALGLTPISLAVFFHEGSTVLVVLNSLRILAYRPRM